MAKDSLIAIIEKCKAMSKDRLVREVVAAPEPTCIIATDQQLADLDRFCCAPRPHNAILGIDPTFNLGDFYVTCTVYRHSGMNNKEGKLCLFHGPMFIHQRKLYETYHQFASGLSRLQPSLKMLKAFGTDGEQALYSAFHSVFPDADHLRCTVHMKRNIKEKLKSMAIPSNVSKEFVREIFGYVEGTTMHCGLIDASSNEEFDTVLDSMQENWNEREVPYTPRASSPQFHSWFLNEKAEDFKECMLPDIRRRNGLGNPPAFYCTNDNEAANKVLKDEVLYRKSQLPEFVDKMQTMLDAQQKRVIDAIVGEGDFVFVHEFQQFHIGDKWWTMTPKQKTAYIGKVSKFSPGHTVAEPRAIQPESHEQSQLSVEPEESAITSVPMHSVRKMFTKAGNLLSEGRVMSIPKKDDQMVVSTESSTYIIQKSARGVIQCDKKTCSTFGMFSICSHCIAAAEYQRGLAAFLAAFNKMHGAKNLSKACQFGIPPGAGTKDGKGKYKKKRKTPAEVTQYISTQRSLCGEDPTTSNVSNSCESSHSNQLRQLQPGMPAPTTESLVTLHAHDDSDLSISVPANDSGVQTPATSTTPVEVPLATLQASVSSSSSMASTTVPNAILHTNAAGLQSASGLSNQQPVHQTISTPHRNQAGKEFWVKPLSNKIKKCAGCGGPYIHEACANLCVAAVDVFTLTFSSGHTVSKTTTIHFHPFQSCIQRKFPHFHPSRVVCSVKLEPEQRSKLSRGLRWHF